MAGWVLYDYVDRRGINQFQIWTENLEKNYRGMLHRRLQAVEATEPGLITGLIVGPIRGYPHIYKLQIGGKVKLRPLLCKGPADTLGELTLLMGATERDFRWEPDDAPGTAELRRQEILADPTRRCCHVKVL